MSFSLRWSWDNRDEAKAKRLPTFNGRTWTRRIQFLEGTPLNKLKLEDGKEYKEILVSKLDAEKIYERFKEGQSINDCISILGAKVPESLQSRRASGQ